MSQIQEIRIQLEGVGAVLKSRRFGVPAYQRSYAWEREHIEALLNDVSEAIKNKEKEYFLGSLVVTGPVDHRYEVVDGQQRLTTVSLVIAAIKDIFVRDNDMEVVMSVRNDYLSSTDRKTKEKEPKLVLNEVDNELFQELIESIPKVENTRFARQSHKRLLDAASIIFAYFEELCKKSKDAEADLHDWLDYLESNLKVIMVTAPDDSNAFIIFETLNDRGLELAISDLLKNYLFHRSGDKIEETKNRWLSMVAVLESASDDPLVVPFLRHFAMSKYGLVREKELFGLIKKKVTTKKLALQFSTDLRDNSKTYSALINTDHDFWGGYDSKVRDCAGALNLLGMVQIRPLLLAILAHFEPKQVKLAFEKLEAVAVRFLIVGGTGGGSLERIYSETAKAVSEEKLTTASGVVRAFSTLPTDSAFQLAFIITTVSKQSLARYYLRKLEEFGAMPADGELVPNKDTGRVNLEHILPLSLGEEWSKNWSADDARAYQRRLGNLAIMSAKINSSLGNEPFETKKSAYKKSSFHFTNTLSASKRWDKAAIDSRQIEMAKLAIKVWSVGG
ncbi:DUF262 domain-containing HNH endonuclease family protein [Polaromonas sp.]|uniref:DUF262 domain-containing protein n=1 Tax=Polaromonas sp. TaxID=1869339 RepID=UPI001848CB6D|nr:DUF262 domain-containing HNH endonuclease family protein [Polaromonas sp.]NMM06956.1 DUF262 domain-containing protein [Polaromonas sp.]